MTRRKIKWRKLYEDLMFSLFKVILVLSPFIFAGLIASFIKTPTPQYHFYLSPYTVLINPLTS